MGALGHVTAHGAGTELGVDAAAGRSLGACSADADAAAAARGLGACSGGGGFGAAAAAPGSCGGHGAAAACGSVAAAAARIAVGPPRWGPLIARMVHLGFLEVPRYLCFS